MNLDNSCIICGTSIGLNTKLTVTNDNVSHTVAVCDEHAEDITPKKAKELVISKINQLNAAMEVIKSFGMTVDNISGIAVVREPEVPHVEILETTEDNPKKIVKVAFKKEGSGNKIEKRTQNVKSIGGVVKGSNSNMETNLDTHDSIDIGAVVDSEMKNAIKEGKISKDVKMKSQVEEVQTFTSRSRGDISIPKKIKHNIGGNTVINIVDTGGDKTIQDRFKKLAENTDFNRGHSFKRDGFDIIDCTVCKGTGLANDRGKQITCPKCSGTGILNRGVIKK